MSDTHPTDLLLDYVDSRLDDGARQDVERHINRCPQCRLEVERQTAAKRAMSRLSAPEMAPDFARRLETAIAAEPLPPGEAHTVPSTTGQTEAHVSAAPQPLLSRRWLLGLGAAAAVGIVAWIYGRRNPSLPQAAADAARAHGEGTLTLTSTMTDADALNTDLGARAGFPVRVFDLGMMGFALRGGRLWAIGDNPSALWVYAGAAGELVCQMFRGSIEDLPEPVESRSERGFTFLVYHVYGETQVFWQEGPVVCVLASNLPSEDVIQLAIAKAMLP